ncbi:sodium/proline symporter [Sesbania bispinosa]|nr:sodium/proline symporter [Sesbania bispinosa]
MEKGSSSSLRLNSSRLSSSSTGGVGTFSIFQVHFGSWEAVSFSGTAVLELMVRSIHLSSRICWEIRPEFAEVRFPSVYVT